MTMSQTVFCLGFSDAPSGLGRDTVLRSLWASMRYCISYGRSKTVPIDLFILAGVTESINMIVNKENGNLASRAEVTPAIAKMQVVWTFYPHAATPRHHCPSTGKAAAHPATCFLPVLFRTKTEPIETCLPFPLSGRVSESPKFKLCCVHLTFYPVVDGEPRLYTTHLPNFVALPLKEDANFPVVLTSLILHRSVSLAISMSIRITLCKLYSLNRKCNLIYYM